MEKKMPKMKIRSMVCAGKGKVLVNCDLNQAESWLVAGLSGSKNMMTALLANILHEQTASAIYEKSMELVTKDERYTGKRVNHASGYRMSPERFTQVYNKDSPIPISTKQARQYSIAWHNLYPEIKNFWWPDIEEQLNKTRTLTTPYGRKRMFFQAWGNELFKEATAYTPQSTVADHFNGLTHPDLGIVGGLLAFKRQVVDKSNGEIRIINQSHDSALLELPHRIASDIALSFMSLLRRPIPINGELVTIPVDAEIGERWGELEKLKSN